MTQRLQLFRVLRAVSLTAALLWIGACDDSADSVDTAVADTTVDDSADSSVADTTVADTTVADTTVADTTVTDTTPRTPTACDERVAEAGTEFNLAGTLRDCGDLAGGDAIADSLMNLDGLTIDNEGAEMTPCISVMCDDTHAFIAANALPHYDFVPLTPNALTAREFIYKIALSPAPIASGTAATAADTIMGCTTAYDAFVADTVPQQEPSGLCAAGGAAGFISDVEDGATHVYAPIRCLGNIALVINGSPIAGPNEAAMPDPFGNPGYNYPNDVNDSYGRGAAVDFCGGHVGMTMHYHVAPDACFERDEAGAPANSYALATANWDIAAAMTADCTTESPIVGWAPDGYPIKGHCVCLSRDDSGACTSLRRARSGWSYKGLDRWGSGAAALSLEGDICDTDADCCTGNNCAYSCSVTLAPTGSGTDTEIGKRCVVVDYSWCTHGYDSRADRAPAADNYVYMDRCNGIESADGYAYHSTLTFPYLLGCFRGAGSGLPGAIAQ